MRAYQAWLAAQQGQGEHSGTLADEALALQRQVTGEASADYLTVASHVASIRLARGQQGAARALLEHIERVGPTLPDYPITDLLGNRYSLATLRFSRGEFELVQRQLAELLPQFDRHIGPLHDRSVVARALYARVLAERGHYDEAVREQTLNVQAVARRSTVEPEALALARLQLVRLLTLDGRHDDSVATAREVLAFFEQRYAQPTRYREQARALLADALLGAGRGDEGRAALQASIDQAARMGRADNPLERAGKQLSLALASRAPGAEAAARAAAQAGQACTTLGAALGPDNPRQQRCLALQTWLAALAQPGDATRQAFVAARSRALGRLARPAPAARRAAGRRSRDPARPGRYGRGRPAAGTGAGGLPATARASAAAAAVDAALTVAA